MVPSLVQQLKREGRSEDSILEMLGEKRDEGLVSYGNKSKVGILLNAQNKKLLNYQRLLQEEQLAKKDTLKNASEFNKAQAEELAKFRQKFQMITGSQDTASTQSDPTRLSMPVADEAWRTTQRESYSNVAMPDLSVHRHNYRKKTPFTMWSNAVNHHGVFFNPPAQGI